MVVLPAFEAGTVLAAIERHRITTVMLVPSMIYALLDHPSFAETDLSSLQTVFYGASPMSPAWLQEAIRKLGPIFFQFYGHTESPQSVCVLRKEDHDPNDLARLSSCGRPVPWVRVGLLDDDGNEVPNGEPGERCVRGPLVMKGYWNKPEETAEARARLARHRRHRPPGHARVPHDRRPQEGHDHLRRVQHLPPRGRRRHLDAPLRCRRRGHRRPGRQVGRSGQGSSRRPARRTTRPGRAHRPREGPQGLAPRAESVDLIDSIPLSPLGKPDKKALRSRYWTGANRLVH